MAFDFSQHVPESLIFAVHDGTEFKRLLRLFSISIDRPFLRRLYSYWLTLGSAKGLRPYDAFFEPQSANVQIVVQNTLGRELVNSPTVQLQARARRRVLRQKLSFGITVFSNFAYHKQRGTAKKGSEPFVTVNLAWSFEKVQPAAGIYVAAWAITKDIITEFGDDRLAAKIPELEMEPIDHYPGELFGKLSEEVGLCVRSRMSHE